jgi:hypothetical protein
VAPSTAEQRKNKASSGSSPADGIVRAARELNCRWASFRATLRYFRTSFSSAFPGDIENSFHAQLPRESLNRVAEGDVSTINNLTSRRGQQNNKVETYNRRKKRQFKFDRQQTLTCPFVPTSSP